MKYLHVGVQPKNLLTVLKHLDSAIIDGDGWESWGEPVGTESNDDLTLHVLVPCPWEDSPEIALAKIKGYLTPMKAPHQQGIIACLTDVEDWSTLNGGVVKNYR